MDPGSPGVVIFLLILAFLVLFTMLTNIFTIFVIFHDFQRKKKLDNKNKFQLALKVTSFTFTTVVTYNEFSTILQPELSKMSHVSPLFAVVIVYAMCSCTWLIALQCFFNFIKIVNFQWVFIPWVKVKISSSVSWQIVTVEVMSLSVSLLQLFLCRRTDVSSTNSSHISTTNMTPEQMIVDPCVSYIIVIVISASLVFSTIVVLFTAAFLRCHINKMKDANTTGEVHKYRAVQTMLLRYLFVYSVFYVMMFLYYFSFFTLYSVGYWINRILVFSFIPAMNVLHILVTPYMRTTWKKMTSSFTLCRDPNTQ